MDIYVGNLSHKTTEDGLRVLFEPHGAIDSVKIMKDKFTGEHRGFGFVRMPNAAEAQVAIAATNGQELDGRNLRVNEARPMEPRTGGAGNGGGGSGFSRGGGSSDRGDRGGGYRNNNRY